MPSNWLYIDTMFPTFTGEEDLEEMFQLPVLGSIPSFDGKRRKTHWGGPGNSTCRYGAQ